MAYREKLPEQYHHIAPDGSEIRELHSMSGGGLAHCLLPAHTISMAQLHKTVDEIWYCLSGKGEVWRKQSGSSRKPIAVEKDASLTIPVGTDFQFRNVGREPLTFLIVTMPPWPGPKESMPVRGFWPRS